MSGRESLIECQAQNSEPRARSWRWVDFVRPFDVRLSLPWPTRHRPYVALHVTTWGHEGGPNGWRRIFWVQFMWGRLFMDCGGSKVWQPRGTTE